MVMSFEQRHMARRLIDPREISCNLLLFNKKEDKRELLKYLTGLVAARSTVVIHRARTTEETCRLGIATLSCMNDCRRFDPPCRNIK
jgi:hypothetical protein